MTSFAAVPFCYRPGATAAQTGFTFTRASTALYRDVNGVWQSAAVDVLRDGHYVGSVRTTLREGAGTNSALGSSNLSITTYWSNAGGITLAAATSCIAGQVATKHTDATGSQARIQNIGTFVNGQTDCAWLLIESVDATNSDIYIYDATAAAVLSRVRVTWSTLAVTVITGSPAQYGAINYGTGPNGGKLVALYLTGTGAAAGTGGAGNTRQVNILPANQAGKASILHHAQFEAATSVPSSPIVTVAAAVTRAADLWSYPWSRVPEAGTWYVDAYWLQASDLVIGSTLFIQNAAKQNPRFRQQVGSGVSSYPAHHNGTADVSCPAGGHFVYGDRNEQRAALLATGAVIGASSINGAAEVVGAASAANAFAAAWSAPTLLYIGTAPDGTFPANLAIRSIAYVPVANVSMANMRIYATTAPIMPWIQTITGTLAPFAIAAERSWFGQPAFTVEDTGTNTLLAAVATPRDNQNARLFSLRVTFSAAPVTGTIVIRDGLTRVWRSEFSATGPFDYEFDFSKKPIRGSMGNDLSVTVDPAGASVVQTVSWSGDFVRSP